MKHTLFASSITAVCLLGSARAADASYTTFFGTTGVSNISFTLGDVSGSVSLNDSSDTSKFWKKTDTWSNTAALNAMNEDLGLTLDTPVLQAIVATGGEYSDATLTLDFTNSDDYNDGDTVTIYLTVGSAVSTVTGVTLTGLTDYSISYATADGDGFSDSASFSEGAGSITLLKVTGTLTSDETVTATTNQEKDGFGFVALSASAVPEPATATLGLLALGALALRRRRA
ncbi:MAG: PEP-CTERM sorting domain-containing protein [Akkermansiaceae bacterium]|nr:PEP-CTERM sorting domain-containing protein [Akkermansiaceae bacterium]